MRQFFQLRRKPFGPVWIRNSTAIIVGLLAQQLIGQAFGTDQIGVRLTILVVVIGLVMVLYDWGWRVTERRHRSRQRPRPTQ